MAETKHSSLEAFLQVPPTAHWCVFADAFLSGQGVTEKMGFLTLSPALIFTPYICSERHYNEKLEGFWLG